MQCEASSNVAVSVGVLSLRLIAMSSNKVKMDSTMKLNTPIRFALIASLPVALALFCADSARGDAVILADNQLDTVVAGLEVSGYSNALATARGSRTFANTTAYTSVRSTGTATGAASGGAAGAAAAAKQGGVATVDVDIRYGVSGGTKNHRFQGASGQGIVARMVAGMSAKIEVQRFEVQRFR